MTRAWCMFEMVTALAKGCKLHVVLNAADVKGFEKLLTNNFAEIAKIVASMDARDAQISKVRVEPLGDHLRTLTGRFPDGRWMIASTSSRRWRHSMAGWALSRRACARRFASGWHSCARALLFW